MSLFNRQVIFFLNTLCKICRPGVLIFLLLLCFKPCHGDIYSWTDRDGVKHFSNIEPSRAHEFEEFSEVRPVFKGHDFRVLKIYDGDTIKAAGHGLTFKIRLVGIDCPEAGYKGQKGQAYSREAASFLENLLKDNTIAVKSYGTGGYDRQLAEIFIGDRNINLEMIKAGLAEVYQGRLPAGLDSERYVLEESRAKSAGRGMWVQGNTYMSPKLWRKIHPRK